MYSSAWDLTDKAAIHVWMSTRYTPCTSLCCHEGKHGVPLQKHCGPICTNLDTPVHKAAVCGFIEVAKFLTHK